MNPLPKYFGLCLLLLIQTAFFRFNARLLPLLRSPIQRTPHAGSLSSLAVIVTATTSITLGVSPQEFVELSGVERFSDGSGYTARLAVGSGRFACSDHPFHFDNLPRFTKDITKVYGRVEGTARVNHIYEKDFVEIEVRGGGRVSVTGSLVQYGPPRQELCFAFNCDQTFLPELLRSSAQVAKELDGTT